jgi:hypothetical protein
VQDKLQHRRHAATCLRFTPQIYFLTCDVYVEDDVVLGGRVPQQPPAKVGRRHAHIVAYAARRHEHGAGSRAGGAAPPVVAEKAVSLALWRLW